MATNLQSIPQEHAPPPTDESHRLVRERVFPPSEFERIMLLVQEERFTGTVTLHCSQGGVCSIQMHEQQKLK